MDGVNHIIIYSSSYCIASLPLIITSVWCLVGLFGRRFSGSEGALPLDPGSLEDELTDSHGAQCGQEGEQLVLVQAPEGSQRDDNGVVTPQLDNDARQAHSR